MNPGQMYVEGSDDQNSFIHLLMRRGIEVGRLRAIGQFGVSYRHGADSPSEGFEALRRELPNYLANAAGRSIGIVVDADADFAARWQAIRNCIRNAGFAVPDDCPPAGWEAEFPDRQSRLGVWIMPDNGNPGALEDMLRTLVPGTDPLWRHAEASTNAARALAPERLPAPQPNSPDTLLSKAALHCWLAWRPKPGLPFGAAINAQFFGDDSPAALAFVAWAKRLFGWP
jgi:hypothetical protein